MLGARGDPQPTTGQHPHTAHPPCPPPCSPDVAGLGLVHDEQVAVHLVDELRRNPAQRHPQLVGRHKVVVLPSMQGQYEKRTSKRHVKDRAHRRPPPPLSPATLHHHPAASPHSPSPGLCPSAAVGRCPIGSWASSASSLRAPSADSCSTKAMPLCASGDFSSFSPVFAQEKKNPTKSSDLRTQINLLNWLIGKKSPVACNKV